MKNPQAIIITGASSGLGAGLARAYAAPGVTLLLTGRNQARLGEVAAYCEGRGAQVLTAVVDVADREAMDQLLTDFDRAHETDLVIANAGIGHGTGRYLMERAHQTAEVVDINVAGVTNTVMPLVNRMAARGRGQIAVMASVAGYAAISYSPTYAASKAFVKHWGEALRGRLKPFGVAVTTLCPGFVRSPMTDANRFPMPFLMDHDRAIAIMKRGLEAGQGRVSFPWPVTWAAGLLGALPSFIAMPLMTLRRRAKLPPLD